MNTDTVHIAMTDAGTVACITTDPVVANALAEQDLSVEMGVPALVALQRLQGEAPWRRLADHEAWQRLSRAMDVFSSTMAIYDNGETAPLFPTTPPDLPPLLIEGRSSVIESCARSVDISSMRELTEIKMALIEKREVDQSHFRAESLQTSWGKMKHEPLTAMYAHLDRLHLNMRHDVGEDTWHHEATSQLIREIEFVIDQRLSTPEGKKEFTALIAREHGEPINDPAASDAPNPLADLFHAIYSDAGDLVKVTMNDTESSMAQAEGLTVVPNTTADELLDYLIGRKSLLQVMDAQTWQRLGKTLLETVAREVGVSVFSVNSADLPLPLAEQRLDIVERFFEPGSVRAWVELSEIVMAREHQRPVNPRLFSPESLADQFSDKYEQSRVSLEQELDCAQEHADEIRRENASEQAAFGDSGPGSAKAAALAKYAESEAAFLVEHWSAMQGDLSDSEDASVFMR